MGRHLMNIQQLQKIMNFLFKKLGKTRIWTQIASEVLSGNAL